MFGKTMLMDLRKGWKGFLIFIVVVSIVAAGYPQMHPAFVEDLESDELHGAEFVTLEIYEDEIHLSWLVPDGFEGAEWLVVDDGNPYMATYRERNRTYENHTILDKNDDIRYFGVIGLVNGEEKPLGMTSTEEATDPVEELMDTPFVRLFSAGRDDLSMADMAGFVSIEVYSWWIILVGVFLSYISVKSITDDMENRRMDIIFSTSISRKKYLLEKFSALTLFVLVMHIVAGLMMSLSIYSVGEPVGSSYLVAMLIAVPLFMVIIAMSMFFAVLLKKSRTAVGLSFGVVLIQFGFFATGHLVESLSGVHPFTLPHYWDYNSVLLDGVVYPWHIFLLLLLAVATFAATLKVFQNSDIPS